MATFEKLFVNSPLWTLPLTRVYVPRVLRLADAPLTGPVLEIGCGKGATTASLAARSPRAKLTAVDYDASQVARARRRLGDRAWIEKADATRLPFSDESFSAVVEFNCFHHIRDYRAAVCEVSRVLAPRGEFLFMDLTAKLFEAGGGLAGWAFPPESRFSRADFASALQEGGLRVDVLRGERAILGRATKPG